MHSLKSARRTLPHVCVAYATAEPAGAVADDEGMLMDEEGAKAQRRRSGEGVKQARPSVRCSTDYEECRECVKPSPEVTRRHVKPWCCLVWISIYETVSNDSEGTRKSR